ncbi:MAG: sel1 repeat family protein [Succinivibrio sp.]|nr:sel1 repeat family protein [Succinivibrio sp.]
MRFSTFLIACCLSFGCFTAGAQNSMQTMEQLMLESCMNGRTTGCVGVELLNMDDNIAFENGLAVLRKQCDKGDAQACVWMGLLYEKGNGNLAPDLKTAVEYYKKSCDQGVSTACIGSGLLSQEGRGIPEDIEAARRAFDKACKLGEKKGCEYLDKIR